MCDFATTMSDNVCLREHRSMKRCSSRSDHHKLSCLCAIARSRPPDQLENGNDDDNDDNDDGDEHDDDDDDDDHDDDDDDHISDLIWKTKY